MVFGSRLLDTAFPSFSDRTRHPRVPTGHPVASEMLVQCVARRSADVDIMELATLADVRILVEKHLPKEYRSKFSWRRFAGLFKRAADGQQDVSEVSAGAENGAGARGRVTPVERRRFPRPWEVQEATESFCLRDAKGQALAYVYFEDKTGRRTAMNRLTRDETRRIAANIAKLPALLNRPHY